MSLIYYQILLNLALVIPVLKKVSIAPEEDMLCKNPKGHLIGDGSEIVTSGSLFLHLNYSLERVSIWILLLSITTCWYLAKSSHIFNTN